MRKKIEVIDLFCGAGGFSEGLRLAGFKPILGIDNWQPAVETYAKNLKAECRKIDISDLANDLGKINQLPNTQLIVGGPPCVSFSNSNRSGGADKTLGVSLIKSFFRIIVIKKYQKKSKLKGWIMENVPKSSKYLQERYSFNDLGLHEWARENNFSPDDVAIDTTRNRIVIDSSELGVPQKRKRLFVFDYEGVKLPEVTKMAEECMTLGEVLRLLPAPNSKKLTKKISDPNYPDFHLAATEIDDHYYDTGIEYRYWKESKYLKTNHPYMGKMSFPEKLTAPSRTVVASPFSRSREAMIFKSERRLKGNGEYRTPTVREIATLMTFPIDYKFYGTEGQKWKLVGNSVCPKVSKFFGDLIAAKENMKILREYRHVSRKVTDEYKNLNSKRRKYEAIPRRKKDARFRMHPFKYGNMTIALTNFDLEKNSQRSKTWKVYATHGISISRKLKKLNPRIIRNLESLIKNCVGENYEPLMSNLESQVFSNVPICANELQRKYEEGLDYIDKRNPVTIIEKTRLQIERFVNGGEVRLANNMLNKQVVPVKQLVAAYVLLKVSQKINGI